VAVAVSRRAFARGDVYLVQLDPTRGHELRKTRPCVIVSPDELNTQISTVIVAPMTTHGRAASWRPACRFRQRPGIAVLDQLRTVDTTRLVKRLGPLAPDTLTTVLVTLQELFAVEEVVSE
jgi:mRNA interferase MazF